MEFFTEVTETVKYPYQVCGIFKVPARVMSDNISYSNEQD